MKWTDSQAIAIALADAHPDVDPRRVNFVDLRDMVVALDGFADDPKRSGEKVLEAIQTCYDPEIPVNIYELGLIYGVEVAPNGAVTVQMTLTSPNCPSAAELPGEVERKVRAVSGVTCHASGLVSFRGVRG